MSATLHEMSVALDEQSRIVGVSVDAAVRQLLVPLVTAGDTTPMMMAALEVFVVTFLRMTWEEEAWDTLRDRLIERLGTYRRGIIYLTPR